MQPQIFEELEAFDPSWKDRYHRLIDAVVAASAQTPYIMEMYTEFLQTPEGNQYLSQTDVPDVKKYIEDCQKAEEESPFFQRAMRRLSGSLPRGEFTDE